MWWIGMSIVGVISLSMFSAPVFYLYYAKPSYETWRWKSNPVYPPPAMIRSEIIQMLKGVATATICPALSLWLSHRGLSQSYCGWGGYSGWYHLLQFFVIWIVSDFFEFFYHRQGHSTDMGWNHHRAHHRFFNPSPFAVIADEYVDQFIRSMPLLLFPLVMPMNMDLLFATFAVFFYGYGTYLHWGFESQWLSAHNGYINTAYQHYLHHAKSIKNQPYHTGFFFKCWDQLFGSVYKGQCDCCRCCQKRGLRTLEEYKKIVKPDYSVLLSPSFWIDGFKAKASS
jgi:lathosterol oxidase